VVAPRKPMRAGRDQLLWMVNALKAMLPSRQLKNPHGIKPGGTEQSAKVPSSARQRPRSRWRNGSR
jgi:hypothetical protein